MSDAMERLEAWRQLGMNKDGCDYRCEMRSPWSHGLGFNWEVLLWSNSTQQIATAVGRTLDYAINAALNAWETPETA